MKNNYNIGEGIQLNVEPYSKNRVKMHIADFNYGLIWWPTKKKILKLIAALQSVADKLP